MRLRNMLGEAVRSVTLAISACALAALSGCGMPAAPQPPSLELPEPVSDLTATRNGNEVALKWTMPKRDTSKVTLMGDIPARVCRREANAACATIATLQFAPGVSGAFTETLPAALAAGDPRGLNYFVELVNKRGRSAGQSNAATVLAGQAPAPVIAFTAEVRKDGIVLRWTPGPPGPYPTLMRLERTLLTPAPAKPAQGPLAEAPEPVKQNLIVPPTQMRGRVIDKEIRFGETYEYRAQRIARLTIDGKEVELDGPLSAPVRVDAQNVFAPAVPVGLAAVATPGENGSAAAIDLSWQPDTDSDLAGYAVYRREAGQAENAWQRISPAQPVVGPGFHDANVQAGHTYDYAVTAIGQNGRESDRSATAQETVAP
jgi:hypothetical protein